MDRLTEWQNSESVDFWEPPGAQHVRVMVAPDTQEEFVNFLVDSNIEHELIIENVERYLQRSAHVSCFLIIVQFQHIVNRT